jgi:hypothetical protein
MALVYRLNSLSQSDVINQGYRFTAAGTVATVTGTKIQDISAADRSLIITSFVLTSDSATGIRVRLIFSNGSQTATFFDGYVSAGGPVSLTYGFGDERYGPQGYYLTITTGGSNVGYTVNGRVVSSPVPTGYLSFDNPAFADFAPDNHNARSY